MFLMKCETRRTKEIKRTPNGKEFVRISRTELSFAETSLKKTTGRERERLLEKYSCSSNPCESEVKLPSFPDNDLIEIEEIE